MPVSPMIEPIIRTNCLPACLKFIETMKRDRLERLEELEKVFCGLFVVFLVPFSLLVFVGFLILAAAVLSSAHRSAAIIFPLDSHWTILLRR